MKKIYFKYNEVIPYEPTPTPVFIPPELQGATIIESKTAVEVINGIPQNTYTEDPRANVYGILQNPNTKEKWYSLNKVVNKVNGAEKYDDDGKIIHPIFDDPIGFKNKKSRDVILKKAHQLNDSEKHIKIYKNDNEIYIHESLLNSLIKYYRNEIPNLTAKKSSSLKKPSLTGYKNILVDIVKTDRIRKNNNKRNQEEKLKIIDEIKVLNKNASPDLLDSVYNEIIDIIIKNDTARNDYISHRIESEFENAIDTKEKNNKYDRELLELYKDAFNDLYFKVIGGINVKGSIGNAEVRQKEFLRQKKLYSGGIRNADVANRVYDEADYIKKRLDESIQKLSEDHFLN